MRTTLFLLSLFVCLQSWLHSASSFADPRLFSVDKSRSDAVAGIKIPQFFGLMSKTAEKHLGHWFVAVRLDPKDWTKSGFEAAVTPIEVEEKLSEIRISSVSLQKVGETKASPKDPAENDKLPALLSVVSEIKCDGKTVKTTFPLKIEAAENETFHITATVPMNECGFFILKFDLRTMPETQYASQGDSKPLI